MSIITFHIHRGDKKKPVIFHSPKMHVDKSGQRDFRYHSRTASGNFGSIFCGEYQGELGFFRLIRVSLRREIAFSISCTPGSVCLDFCLRGLFRHTSTRIKPGILVNTQHRLYLAGAKQKTSYLTGPTGKSSYSMLQISAPLRHRYAKNDASRTEVRAKHLLEDQMRYAPIDGIFYSDTSLTKWIQAIRGELARKNPRSNKLDWLLTLALLAAADLPKPLPVAKTNNSIRDEEAHRVSVLAENIILGMDEYWSVPKLAGSAKYSEAKLKFLFKKNIGMSSTAFKISVRLEKAKQSLLHSQLPVREIATAVGYSNAAHFSRLFKNKTGCSPTAFRKNKTMKKDSAERSPV